MSYGSLKTHCGVEVHLVASSVYVLAADGWKLELKSLSKTDASQSDVGLLPMLPTKFHPGKLQSIRLSQVAQLVLFRVVLRHPT